MPGILDKVLADGLIGKIVDAVSQHIPIPADQTKRMELESAIEQALVAGLAAQNVAQAETNKIEAASPNLFVSGWRPAIGWTCAISLACYYVPRAIAATVLWVIAVAKTGLLLAPPNIGIADILGLVMAMLGVASLRTYEKVQSVQDKH